MYKNGDWNPVEGTVESILESYRNPFRALREGQVPALILRGAYPPSHCEALICRFYDLGLLYSPKAGEEGTGKRVDIGTSLGTHSVEPDRFFEHAGETHRTFESLFDGFDDPVATIYDAMAQLLTSKKVLTARESDGRLYGPAIFRCYHAGLGHRPHYDSVSKRSRLFNYQVSRFDHQFAAVMCFQNSEDAGNSGEALLYNAPISPVVGEHLTGGTFHEFAADRNIDRIRIRLEPGDLYFFYSENIHEVPGVVGDTPRVVLAVFIGFSEDDDEVFVWS